jgi:hypothetical protein
MIRRFSLSINCKAWKLDAQRVLYANVKLRKERRLWKLLNSSDKSLGMWTRHLDYNIIAATEKYEYYQHDAFLQYFVDFFPLLEHINTSQPNYAFYAHMISERSQSRWQILKSIEGPQMIEV